MNQDSSFPPMLPPSTELGALLFAALPCLQETYRPLASFAFHFTELSKLRQLPAVPPISQFKNIDAFIADKEGLSRSLSFYGTLFRMPLLSTIANLLQGIQFYKAYKDILPGLFSAMNGNTGNASSFDSMAGLFSGLGGGTSDLFSALGGLSPEFLSSMFSGFSGSPSSNTCTSSDTCASSAEKEETPRETESHTTQDNDKPDDLSAETCPEAPPQDPPCESDSDALYNSLYSFMTPEQKEIYEQLMHTD